MVTFSSEAEHTTSMEASAAGKPNKSLSKSTASFRLRCPSLNSLRLRRIFDLFDKNGDGMITVSELSQALNVLGLESDLYDLLPVVNSFIKSGNEGLTYEDFESLHESLNETHFGIEEEETIEVTVTGSCDLTQEESDLTEAFKVFDEDGDGYISAEELQTVLRKLGLAEGGEIGRVQQMIISVDRNHDGRVDFFEFKDMMRSVIVHSS